MNYLLLPDMFAMSLLVGVLLALRSRRHERDSMQLWVAGLLMILAECAAHILYTVRGTSLLVHRLSHIVALDTYLLAGVLFMLSASPTLRSTPHRRVFVSGTSAPFLVILSLYGADVSTRWPYYVCIATALLAGFILCLVLRRTWRHVAVYLVVWSPAVLGVYWGDFRGAAYSILFFIYLLCAVSFRRSLPKHSRGGMAVIAGFAIWSLCFVTHPWIAQSHPSWIPFAGEVWDMQKFVITVGLLVVMLEEQMSGMEWASLHDELTGLGNRRMFDQQLRTYLERAVRYQLDVTVFTLDLDGFKPVNDTYGHHAGDVLLRQVAANLEAASRHIGSVARMGGDEFSLIVCSPPDETDKEVERIFGVLLDAVETPVNLGPAHSGRVVRISASIGAATCPPGVDDINELMREADNRMYEQKTTRSTRRQRRSAQRSAIVQCVA